MPITDTTSLSPSMRKPPYAVLQGAAKLHVVNQLDTPLGAVQEESSDIKAFCSLVARILIRCLRERDEKALQILGFSKEQRFTDDAKEKGA
jgi:hypothetical protein